MRDKSTNKSNLRKVTQDHWLREQAITKALRAEYAQLLQDPVPSRLKELVAELRRRERQERGN